MAAEKSAKESELSAKKYTFMGESRIPRFINRLLFPGERICFALKAFRDIGVFTDKRVLIINYRYVTEASVEYYTYLYKNVITYSLATPGYGLDMDSDVVFRFINQEVVHFQIEKGHNLDKYLYLIYDLVSAVVNGHDLHPGVFRRDLTVKENNEQFFE